MDVVSIRADDLTGLDFFGKVLKENRSKVVRTLINEGRKAKAVQLYKNKKVSIGSAAKLAGVSLSEFIDLLKEYNVRLNLELDDVKEAMKAAEELI